MKQFTGISLAIAAVAAMSVTGCMRRSTVDPEMTDQQYFMDVVSGGDASTRDLAVSELDALGDGAMYGVSQKALPPSIQSVTAGDKIVPQQWGRFFTSISRTITRTMADGDTVANAEVLESFTGTFVIVGTVNGVLDTVKKPFTESMHRYFRFVRVANTQHPRMNWRLDAISVLNGGTTNSTISITQLQVVPPSGDTITATDPDNYWMQVQHGWMRHPLPLWGFNTQVTVIATVHSTDTDTDLVMLHYVPRNFGLHRAPMTKISETVDAGGAFVRTYSAVLTIPGNDRKFSHVLVSATTNSSLYSSDSTKFSSAIWGVPYKTSN